MRSRRSVISRSRDWMIRLMSLMRGPKFASSLSSLDFSCITQMKTFKSAIFTKHQRKMKPKAAGCTCMLRDRCLVFVCSRSLWEYFSLICRPCAWDCTWRSSASFLFAFICSWKKKVRNVISLCFLINSTIVSVIKLWNNVVQGMFSTDCSLSNSDRVKHKILLDRNKSPWAHL